MGRRQRPAGTDFVKRVVRPPRRATNRTVAASLTVTVTRRRADAVKLSAGALRSLAAGDAAAAGAAATAAAGPNRARFSERTGPNGTEKLPPTTMPPSVVAATERIGNSQLVVSCGAKG